MHAALDPNPQIGVGETPRLPGAVECPADGFRVVGWLCRHHRRHRHRDDGGMREGASAHGLSGAYLGFAGGRTDGDLHVRDCGIRDTGSGISNDPDTLLHNPIGSRIPGPGSRLYRGHRQPSDSGGILRAVHPVVFQWGPLVIRWYGVMMAITVLTTAAMALRMGPRLGVPAREIDRLILPFVLLAFVGARLGYVLSHPAEFMSPAEILRIYHGGLTSHGAIAGGFVTLWWASRRRGLPLWSLADATVWAVPLGNIFVRFGNFMNGELYGDVTALPWAVTFPGEPGPRHPLQIYEMLLAVVTLALTLPLVGRRRFPGQVFWSVVVLTSVGRILLDLLRREDRVFGIVTLGQIPAAILIVIGVWFLLRKSRQSAQSARSAQS